MVRKGTVLFVTVETPLHAGTGAELGVVDLPIQRERHTGWPKVEASSLKGALREAMNLSNDLKNAIFGPEEGDLHSGSLVLTDLRVLFFPVKSGKGTFAWVTSPEVFARFKRDLGALRTMDENFSKVADELPDALRENTVHENSQLTVEDMVLLEEYSFNVKKGDNGLKKFVDWLQEYVFGENDLRHKDIAEKICVVENDMFNDFVRMFTEVITRTRIDQVTGTVKEGALWNEEYLPSETVMYSLMMATPLMMNDEKKPKELKGKDHDEEAEKVFRKVVNSLPKFIFLGGNETIGKGLVSLTPIKDLEANNEHGQNH